MVRVKSVGRLIAQGMLRENTPVEYYKDCGLWVKREDLACPAPGPPFSKTRGVYAHVKSRPEKLIGVLDTRHSQAGHAVARACQILGKKCLNFYPEFKHEKGWREPQERALQLGAELVGLQAGRSAILFHQAKKQTLARGGYMMPNALKLSESVLETAKEVALLPEPARSADRVIVAISSGTIAAGVIRGFSDLGQRPVYLLHMGYSRSHEEVMRYLKEASGLGEYGFDRQKIQLIDENYSYKDIARPGPNPLWPCNDHYDLKAFRWWMGVRRGYMDGSTNLFWNIG